MAITVLGNRMKILFLSLILCFSGSVVLGATDAGDYIILDEFRRGLANPELLRWPEENKDPCGPPLWPHVFCSGSRVAQIQVQNMGLSGPLPGDFNKLSMLTNIGLQRNNFSGKLPTFNGLSELQYAYLGNNKFDAIPADFFVGLTSLEVMSLDMNPLNQSAGWVLPPDLANSAQLKNLSLMECNLMGPLPEFLGTMNSLSSLKLSHNNLTGGIPASYSGLPLQILWMNNQAGQGLTGSLDVIASMTMLSSIWLHGNSFTGPIPSSIGDLTSLKELWLNNNKLVGLVPQNLTSLPLLQILKLDNNMFMGPIPKVKFDFTYSFNSFCHPTPGIPCSPEVSFLLEFLQGVNYPPKLAGLWSGNDPCSGPWFGVSCINGKISVINLPSLQLNGTISPSLGKLDALVDVRLEENSLYGVIPSSLSSLKLLKVLDLSSNNISPPIPHFPSSVTVHLEGNKLLENSSSPGSPSSSPGSPSSSPGSPSTGNAPSDNISNSTQSSTSPSASPGIKPPSSSSDHHGYRTSRKFNLIIVIVPIAVGIFVILLAILFCYFYRKGKKSAFRAPSSIVVHPKDHLSDSDNLVKIVVANKSSSNVTASDPQSANSSSTWGAHLIESGNLVISLEVLRSATRNFDLENVLGKGGFGVVYRGELHDGTMIAVKRMESAQLSSTASDEFHAEISVLSKVRHRNLVSILGYSVEDNESLLVYEYMPQGALSKHLFRWKQLGLEPLSWKKRLNIALDVARGMEYLHNLAHQCFIHRDLKSSNILLGDDYRAKVSDFGLAKLAPDGNKSLATRLAGTFGYLAPEYAVTGKVTTKIDVFSFGVVLMELLTGLMALDEDRPEESQYLVPWFCQVKSTKEKLKSVIDPVLVVTDENSESISIIAELAGHCAAREPQQRPDMGHTVNVLAPLAEKWKPVSGDQEEYLGIDLQQPLLQMVKGWQAADDGITQVSSLSLDDSKGSIPARPAGFAESFTSADGR